MVYVDFESILLSEEWKKKNLDEPYTQKYTKHVSCSYGYKLIYIDDKFSKPFRSFWSEVKDVDCNFVNCIVKERNYCSDVMKKRFNKELVWLKKML